MSDFIQNPAATASTSANPTNNSEDTSLEQFVTYVKVATAAAIIKNKPDGMSGQDFAEQVCYANQQGRIHLREKVHSLEAERQQLRQLYAQQLSAASEQDIFSSALSPCTSMSFSQQLFSQSQDMFAAIEPFVHKNLEYYGTLTRLRRICTAQPQHQQSLMTFKKTVKGAVKTMSEWLTEPARWDVLKDNERCKGIAALVTAMEKTQGRLQTIVLIEVQFIVQNLVYAIVQPKSPNQAMQVQQCGLLLQLCCNTSTVEAVVRELLMCCSQLTGLLRDVEELENISWVQISNSYYIYYLLEQLLIGTPCLIAKYLSVDQTRRMLQVLQYCVGGLDGPCALMAHYLYVILALLENVLDSQPLPIEKAT